MLVEDEVGVDTRREVVLGAAVPVLALGALLVVFPGARRVDGQARRDDEELERHERELGREREEARVQRRLGFGLLERLAVVVVRVREDAAEPARERREVSGRRWRDGQAGAVRGSARGAGAVVAHRTYREGNARGEFSSAVALSSVWRM